MTTTNQTLLKLLIQKSKLTNKQYAIKHNLLPTSLDRWLNGTRIISLQRLEQLAKEDGLIIKIEIL